MVVCKQGCGKTFSADGAWRVRHELKCKGKAQTRGRIERLASRRNGASVRAAAAKTKTATARVVTHMEVQKIASYIGVVTPAAMLAALRAEAAKIQNAIAAIEALT